MFSPNFFAPSYFAPRYFPPGGSVVVETRFGAPHSDTIEQATPWLPIPPHRFKVSSEAKFQLVGESTVTAHLAPRPVWISKASGTITGLSRVSFIPSPAYQEAVLVLLEMLGPEYVELAEELAQEIA